MASGRKRRLGFTLIEMLMAAGILGIGLTMVASIFPVAVDQSRRSRDQTMAALCARSVLAQTRADQNAIYGVLRSQTADFVELSSTAVGNYVARRFATQTSTGGPWRIAIFVCRSIGRGPNPVDDDLWANAVNPTPGKPPPPGPGTYVVEGWRNGAIGHLVDYVEANKTGHFAVGSNSRNDLNISSTATDIQRVPDAVAVFHTLLGE